MQFYDLVYYATRVQDTSDTSAAQKTRLRHDWKAFTLITTWVKMYFHTPKLATCQMKKYKVHLILRINFRKCLFRKPKYVWKCTTKTQLCDGKSYIQKLYAKL